ncbi:hypothetical protein [Salinimonas chungwhensis]|uniref:hypothetical protein n=1 Tax=Salinimonas chungwhensis TaxID=265425 RepID=UPI0012EA8977|nr:hypothetical protein [Salinimonas chungwhensis]
MQLVIKVLSVFALLVSLCWLYFEPSFEPLLTTVVSFSALISSFVFGNSNKDQSESQNQEVSSNSSGIQAGGNVTINNSIRED